MDEALFEIKETCTYIAEDLSNPKAAKDLYDKLMKRIAQMCNYPESGTKVKSVFFTDKSLRKFLVGNYTVYYRPNKETKMIEIIHFIYSKRKVN